MAVLGVFGVALLQASYAFALSLMPVGITLLLEYTAVLMVALFAFFVFREKVKARLWIAIALVLAGLAVVAQVWDSDLDPVGVLFAAVAAVTLAFYFLVGERQVGATSPLTVAFWTMTFATAFWAVFSGWWDLRLATFATPVQLGGAVGDLQLPLLLPLIVTVVLGSFAPFLLSFYALKHLTATAAGIVASAEVIFAFLVAWLWLGEQLDLLQIAGRGRRARRDRAGADRAIDEDRRGCRSGDPDGERADSVALSVVERMFESWTCSSSRPRFRFARRRAVSTSCRDVARCGAWPVPTGSCSAMSSVSTRAAAPDSAASAWWAGPRGSP